MNERTISISFIALLAGALLLGTGSSDVIYLVLSSLFFVICIAYAEWCERL